MSTVHPLLPPSEDDRPLATVSPLASASARSGWLSTCERAWLEPASDSDLREATLAQVEAVRDTAQEIGDEFVVAAAETVLLRELVVEQRIGEAIAGLVPAIADLETYPPSAWAGRAHGALAEAFARLGERDLAIEHYREEQEVGEVLEDLELQAAAVNNIALLTPTSTEKLDAFATAEALFARASVDHEQAIVGGVIARLNRSFTNVELGLVTAAVDQLPYVVEVASSLHLSAHAGLAIALQARCAALSGDVEEGLDGARSAMAAAVVLPDAARRDIAVECATTYLVCERPDLAIEVLDTPVTREDPNLARREQALSLLGDAYHRAGDPRAAFAIVREAEELGAERLAEETRGRLEAMRIYHRTCAEERTLATQRDLSARLFEQVGHLGDRAEGISELAIRDEVTGLPNRRYLDLELRWRCSQRLPGRGVLSLSVVTVDGYDDVVKELGPDDGDRLAIMIAQIVRGNVRSGDAVARIAEDGFAVVQFHRAAESARYAGERLRAAVEAFPWAEHRFGRAITASVGVAALRPPTTPGALVARASTASAQVCVDGGNGVRLSEA